MEQVLWDTVCNVCLCLFAALPLAYVAGIEHEKREQFRKYEQARLAYSAERLNRIKSRRF